MQRIIALRARVGLEHQGADGYERVNPPLDRPLSVRAGDRLWLQVFADDAAYVYGVGVRKQAAWKRAFVSAPGSQIAAGERFPFADGWTLDGPSADMDTLLIVASAKPLPWLEDLDTADCSNQANKPRVENPSTPCEHLVGLFWETPKLIRGKGVSGPPAELIRKSNVALLGKIAENKAIDRTAILFHFKVR